MRFARSLVCVLFFLMLVTGSAHAADRAIIVLDASGSMWGQIDGTAKIDIARQALKSVLGKVPADTELGFMAYGHRQKAACDDIQLMVPPAAGTAAAIDKAAAGINPKGKTPLSDAVRQAAEDLKYTEDKATVILITDGLETCNADPCALASELEKSGVDFTVDVVGFGLTRAEGKQVACLAENTGGTYFEASNAAGLADALTRTVADAAPPPAPPPPAEPVSSINFIPNLKFAADGPDVPPELGNAWEVYQANPDGSRGASVTTEYGNNHEFTLAPGNYVVVGRLGEAKVEQPIDIGPGKTLKPDFILNAGTLVVHPRVFDAEPVADGAAVNLKYPDGETTAYGNATMYLPAGTQQMTVKIDLGSATETFELAAGQRIEKEVVLGLGLVTENALYSEGGDKVTDGGITFTILKAKKKIDGTREELDTSYGPDVKHYLPPGDYVLRAKMDQAMVETPFTVTAGEATDVEPVLDAGVAAISAPGADHIEILGVRKDVQGKQKSFGYAYGETYQATLPAGDYEIIASLPGNGGSRKGAVTVTAGGRSEVTIQ